MRQRNRRQVGTLIVALFMVLNLLVGSVPVMGVRAMGASDETTAGVEAADPMGEEKPASPPAASGSEGVNSESESAESEKPAESAGSPESSESSETRKTPSEDNSTSGSSSDESDGSAAPEASGSETDKDEPDLEISDEEIPDAVGQGKPAVISLELYLYSDTKPQGLPEGFSRKVGSIFKPYIDVNDNGDLKIEDLKNNFYKITCTYNQSNPVLREGNTYSANYYDDAGFDYRILGSEIKSENGTLTATVQVAQYTELILHLRDDSGKRIGASEFFKIDLPVKENGQDMELQFNGEGKDTLYALVDLFSDDFAPLNTAYDLAPSIGSKLKLGSKWYEIKQTQAREDHAYEYDLILKEVPTSPVTFKLHLQTTMWKMFKKMDLKFEIKTRDISVTRSWTLPATKEGPDKEEVVFPITFEDVLIPEDEPIDIKLLTTPSPGASGSYEIASQSFNSEDNALLVQLGRNLYFIVSVLEDFDGKNLLQISETFIDGVTLLLQNSDSEVVQQSTKGEMPSTQKFTALLPGTYTVVLEKIPGRDNSKYILPLQAELIVHSDGHVTLNGAGPSGEGTHGLDDVNKILLDGIKTPFKLLVPRRPLFHKEIFGTDGLNKKITTVKAGDVVKFEIPITIYPDQNIYIYNIDSNTKELLYGALHKLTLNLSDMMTSQLQPNLDTIQLQERKDDILVGVSDYSTSYENGVITLDDKSETLERAWTIDKELKLPAPRELLLSFEAKIDPEADLDAILENSVISHGQKDKVQLIPLVDLEVTKNWKDMTKDEIRQFHPVFKLSQIDASGNVLASWKFDQDHSGLLNDDGSTKKFEFTWSVGDTIDGLPVPEQDPEVIKTTTVSPKVTYEMVDGKGVYSIKDLPRVDANGNKVSYQVKEVKILKGDQDVTDQFDSKVTHAEDSYTFTFDNSKKPTETTSTTKPTRPTSTRPSTSQTTTTQPITPELTTTTQPTTSEPTTTAEPTTTTQPTTTPTATETTTTETTTTETTTMETTTIEPTTLPPTSELPTTEPPTTPPTTTEPTIAKTGEDYPWGAPALLLLMAGCLYIIRKRHERG